MGGDLAWLTARPIAHRGLHDATLPENSLAAARAAIAHGFAIECDVLLSRDEVPHVFHDHDLARLTGATGPFAERTAAELADLRLKDSAEPIPTVAGFLAEIGGRVPVVMELKGSAAETDIGFMGRLAPVLDGYGGRLALMSFDVWLLEQALDHGERIVGLTAEGTSGVELERHARVFAKGCHFLSYDVDHLPNPFVDEVRAQGAPAITWTVRRPDQVEATRRHADQMTFEGFLPQD